MFLKLWKYELKCSYRGYLLMYVLLLLPTLFVNASSEIVQVLSSLLYACMIFVILIMTFVMIIRTYQQSMFSKNAYLTLTLPVSGKTLMAVKVINATMWFLLSYIVILLSVMIVGLRVSGIPFSDLIEGFGFVFKNVTFESWIILLNLTISLLQTVTMIYMIMNFTHTNYIRKHRGLIAIAIFVVLNILISFINGFLFGSNMDSTFSLFFSSTSFSNGIFQNSIYISTIENLLILVACYFAASYILDHKLEIE